MTGDVSKNSGKLILSVVSVCCVCFLSARAFAASSCIMPPKPGANCFAPSTCISDGVQDVCSPPGCHPKVMKAMKASAKAHEAYDVAVATEVFSQPDSVLALTCFNQIAGGAAAGPAAPNGWFSGDFTAELGPVIEPALGSFYGGFTDAIGKKDIAPGRFAETYYGAAAQKLSTNTDCEAMKKLWDLVTKSGLQSGGPYDSSVLSPQLSGIPYATSADLENYPTNGISGGVSVLKTDGGPDFKASMDKSAPAFADLKTATDTLFQDPITSAPLRVTPELPPLSSYTTACDVLKNAMLDSTGAPVITTCN